MPGNRLFGHVRVVLEGAQRLHDVDVSPLAAPGQRGRQLRSPGGRVDERGEVDVVRHPALLEVGAVAGHQLVADRERGLRPVEEGPLDVLAVLVGHGDVGAAGLARPGHTLTVGRPTMLNPGSSVARAARRSCAAGRGRLGALGAEKPERLCGAVAEGLDPRTSRTGTARWCRRPGSISAPSWSSSRKSPAHDQRAVPVGRDRGAGTRGAGAASSSSGSSGSGSARVTSPRCPGRWAGHTTTPGRVLPSERWPVPSGRLHPGVVARGGRRRDLRRLLVVRQLRAGPVSAAAVAPVTWASRTASSVTRGVLRWPERRRRPTPAPISGAIRNSHTWASGLAPGEERWAQ